MAKGDMFLKIDGQKQGAIKGEATDPRHVDEIEVSGWSWGIDGSVTAFAAATARSTMQKLVVRKRVDTASTGLMSALRNNETIKKAILSVRKAGGVASIPFLTITLEQARIASHRIYNVSDGAPELGEEIHLAFLKVQVEYRKQDDSGAGQGVNTFMDEVVASH